MKNDKAKYKNGSRASTKEKGILQGYIKEEDLRTRGRDHQLEVAPVWAGEEEGGGYKFKTESH